MSRNDIHVLNTEEETAQAIEQDTGYHYINGEKVQGSMKDGVFTPAPTERPDDSTTSLPPPPPVDFVQNPFNEMNPLNIPEPEQEEDTILDRMRRKLGTVGRKIEEAQPLTEQAQAQATNAAEVVANGLHGLLGLLFAFMGPEYKVLNPGAEKWQKVTAPLMRIAARHNAVVAKVSPDVVDMGQAFRAASDIVTEIADGVAQIRWMKRNGYEMVPAGMPVESGHENGANREAGVPGSQYNTVSGSRRGAPETNDSMPANGGANFTDSRPEPLTVRTGLGTVGDFSSKPLSENDRRNHDALLALTRRDIQSRRRRAGFLS